MNIKQTLREANDKLFSSTLLKIIVIISTVILLACAVQAIKHEQTKYEKAVAEWSIERDSILKKNTILNKQNDSINKIIQIREHKADSLSKELKVAKGTIKKKKAQLDAQLDSLENGPTPLPPECNICITMAKHYKALLDSSLVQLDKAEERDSLRVIDINALKYANLNLLSQNDSLVHVINNVPKYKEDKFLGFIPLPSRKTSLVAGIVTGIVVTAATVTVVH